jgi:hypothetical protein
MIDVKNYKLTSKERSKLRHVKMVSEYYVTFTFRCYRAISTYPFVRRPHSWPLKFHKKVLLPVHIITAWGGGRGALNWKRGEYHSHSGLFVEAKRLLSLPGFESMIVQTVT